MNVCNRGREVSVCNREDVSGIYFCRHDSFLCALNLKLLEFERFVISRQTTNSLPVLHQHGIGQFECCFVVNRITNM